MKVVAAPFRADNAWEVEQNVRAAEGVALELWRLGCRTRRSGAAGDTCVQVADRSQGSYPLAGYQDELTERA